MKTKNDDTAVSRLTNYNIINNIGKKKETYPLIFPPCE